MAVDQNAINGAIRILEELLVNGINQQSLFVWFQSKQKLIEYILTDLKLGE